MFCYCIRSYSIDHFKTVVTRPRLSCVCVCVCVCVWVCVCVCVCGNTFRCLVTVTSDILSVMSLCVYMFLVFMLTCTRLFSFWLHRWLSHLAWFTQGHVCFHNGCFLFIPKCRRYLAEILPIRHKTLTNRSINTI